MGQQLTGIISSHDTANHGRYQSFTLANVHSAGAVSSKTPFVDQYHTTAALNGPREDSEVPLDTPVVRSRFHTTRGGSVAHLSPRWRERQHPYPCIGKEVCWRDCQGMGLAWRPLGPDCGKGITWTGLGIASCPDLN